MSDCHFSKKDLFSFVHKFDSRRLFVHVVDLDHGTTVSSFVWQGSLQQHGQCGFTSMPHMQQGVGQPAMGQPAMGPANAGPASTSPFNIGAGLRDADKLKGLQHGSQEHASTFTTPTGRRTPAGRIPPASPRGHRDLHGCHHQEIRHQHQEADAGVENREATSISELTTRNRIFQGLARSSYQQSGI